jgi:hypothetical protein
MILTIEFKHDSTIIITSILAPLNDVLYFVFPPRHPSFIFLRSKRLDLVSKTDYSSIYILQPLNYIIESAYLIISLLERSTDHCVRMDFGLVVKGVCIEKKLIGAKIGVSKVIYFNNPLLDTKNSLVPHSFFTRRG